MARLISPIKTNLDQIFLIQMFLFLDFQTGTFSCQVSNITFDIKIFHNQSLKSNQMEIFG